MAKKKKIAAILARVSRPTQSLESQVEDLRKIAKEKDYEVPQEFVFTEKITGMNAVFKKSLNDLLAALDNPKNHIEAVFIWEITRLNRGAYDFAAELSQLNSKNVPVYFLDLDMWTWDFQKNTISKENCDKLIGAAFYGRTEWEKIANRTKRGRDNKAKQGLYVGHLSDGYCVVIEGQNKKIDVDEDRRGVIERIFLLFEQGYSSDRIADILNADGVPTTNRYRVGSEKFKGYKKDYHRKGSKIPQRRDDSRWSGSLISAILKNEWYKGIRRYKSVKEPLSVEPIIDEAQWNRVQAMIAERKISFRSKKESKTHLYLLAGLIYCGKCGRKMYGHFTGLNNHYYCSSVEGGCKCGTRGVCKENVEAILANVIKTYALNETFQGVNNPITDFFKLDKREEKTIKDDIINNNKIIEDLKGRIEERQQDYDNAVELSAKYAKDKRRFEAYNKAITKADTDIKEWRDQIMKLIRVNTLNEKKLKSDKNIKDLVHRIQATDDLELLRELFKTAIGKITIYNADASITILVIDFVKGATTKIIYSHRLLKNYYLPIMPPLDYDCESGELRSSKLPIIIASNGVLLYDDLEKYNDELLYIMFGEKDKDYQVFEGDIPIRTYISLLRHSEAASTYERLEELTDEAKAQDAKYKEWRKKYNTGYPTSLPSVIKDANYETIRTEKKRLYNRKYKIKNNKSLSEQDKQIELSKIDERLSILSAQVKYLTRDEAIEEYKKKHN